jgi:rod shape-determining protein MreD
MTPSRLAAATAAIVTALVLQATFVAPLAGSAPVSLLAVLVAAVALVSGPGTGIAFGFTAGLLADLGSEHPAGVLALVWLGVGILSGLLGDRLHRLRDAVVVVGLVAGVAASMTTLVLTLLGSAGATVGSALVGFVPSALGDALLAALLVPLVRLALRSQTLRRPVPARSDSLAGHHG